MQKRKIYLVYNLIIHKKGIIVAFPKWSCYDNSFLIYDVNCLIAYRNIIKRVGMLTVYSDLKVAVISVSIAR